MFNNIRDLHLIYTSPRVWRLLCGQANESNYGASSIRNSISILSCIHVLYKMSCILENYRASLCDGFYYVVLNIVAKHINYHMFYMYQNKGIIHISFYFRISVKQIYITLSVNHAIKVSTHFFLEGSVSCYNTGT